jgi:hypothetical protein
MMAPAVVSWLRKNHLDCKRSRSLAELTHDEHKVLTTC